MDYEALTAALSLHLESVLGPDTNVWTYRPAVFRSRGKQFSYRNRLRRERFYDPRTSTIWRVSPTP